MIALQSGIEMMKLFRIHFVMRMMMRSTSKMMEMITFTMIMMMDLLVIIKITITLTTIIILLLSILTLPKFLTVIIFTFFTYHINEYKCDNSRLRL